MRRTLLFELVQLLVTVAMHVGTCVQADFFVGVAQVDITPPVGFRCGGGYGEVISTAVHDPLFAKALVFRQGNASAAIVISDLLSVPPELSRRARDESSRRTGIPAENIIVAATHNHGSPEYWGTLRNIAHDAAEKQHGHDPHERVNYQEKLVHAWIDAIEKARTASVAATLQMVVAQQPGLAFNRRFHMSNGTVRFNPGVGNSKIVRPAGPVDIDLPFLLFHSTTNARKPFASLTTFAMHTAVHGGTDFSGDFPAVLQSRLQEKLGPEFVSLFAEGTAGDINHIDVNALNQRRGRPEVERIGNTLSATLLEAFDQLVAINDPNLAIVSKTASTPFSPVSESRFHQALEQIRDQRTLRLPFLTVVAAWRDCHRYRYGQQFDGKKPMEVQGIRLNADNAIVTLPHEVFVEIGMAIKATSPFRNTIVISLANDVDFYIPTRRAFEEGSYEVTTCPLDAGCGEILLETAQDVLNALKKKPANRDATPHR